MRGAAIAACMLVVLAPAAVRVRAAPDTLPERLTDQELWTLSQQMSEPNGYFRSDNLLSNEIYYPAVLPDLLQRVKPGAVYLGVGPEQNFNYIVALKPKMAFITDVRRGNLHTQLMYKALVEMSTTRADFYARLFTKPRPDGLADDAPVSEIVRRFAEVATSGEEVYRENLEAIRNHLTKSPHRFPLSAEDLDGIEYVYRNFYWFGPSITYNSSSGGGNRSSMSTYAALMTVTDNAGAATSYLASEEAFAFLRALEARNLVVPIVGNFGGPKALRAVGAYVREHGAVVGAFYLSNVEQYLNQDGIWSTFCANVATMPLDESSTFIRSGGGGFGWGGGLTNRLGSMAAETRVCGGSQD
ncbi:MAG: hypothetical protein IT184_11255 [Acidobacteria bacterium]|nr:hypothetical protein [Acidobacteriota bacterium]